VIPFSLAEGPLPAGAIPPRAPGAERPAQVRAAHRILVAEDQQVNWMLIERMLIKRGHHAVNATNGDSVLEKLESEQYDLILMDCHMPLLDGYDTAREIRRREATGHRARTPIVAMTANAMLGDRERCVAAGMDDYMSKPISAEVLDELLARWLAPGHEIPRGARRSSACRAEIGCSRAARCRTCSGASPRRWRVRLKASMRHSAAAIARSSRTRCTGSRTARA